MRAAHESLMCQLLPCLVDECILSFPLGMLKIAILSGQILVLKDLKS
jgi:hypothetical protein